MSRRGTATTELKRKSGAVPPRHRYPWTEDETALLRELYGTVPTIEIARRLERTYQTVQNRIHQIGLADRTAACQRCGEQLTHGKVGRVRRYCAEGTECYTERTFARYRQLNPLQPAQDCECEQCGKPYRAPENRQRFCSRECGKRWWHLQQQALPRSGRRVDDPGVYERILQLRDQGMSLRAIGRELQIQYTSIQRVVRNGGPIPLSPWTPEMEQYVLEHQPTQSARQIGDHLGLTAPQVAGRILKLRREGRLPAGAK